MKTLIDEITSAQEAGWTGKEKKPRKRKSTVELGAKHAARLTARRAVTDAVPGLFGMALATLVSGFMSKKMK